jgi:DNA-binding LacI/PurR family transcriptional regulator
MILSDIQFQNTLQANYMKNEDDATMTMEKIAKIAGVSKPTVSRVLNNYPHVAKKTREKVLEAASKYGYSINRQAQRLRAKQSNAIAVMLDFPSFDGDSVSDPFIFDLLSGISHKLTENSQDLLLLSPPLDDKVEFYQHLISSKNADGIIFLGRGLREYLLNDLAKTNVPFVVWGSSLENSPFCTIGSDGFDGGIQAGKYLIDKGRRNILFVGDTRHKEIYARRAGLQQAVNDSELEIKVMNLTTSSFSADLNYNLAINLAKSGTKLPDALFTYSDSTAIAFISAFSQIGLKAPEDYNIVGYNNINLSKNFQPSLTSINQNSKEAGKLLVENLEKIINKEKPSSVLLKAKLIDRGS